MDLHEFQAKRRFHEFGIPVPLGEVAHTPEEAYEIAKKLDSVVVVKAQVFTGGRGKAGGVKLAKTAEEAREHAEAIINMDIKGHTVHKVLIDPGANIQSPKSIWQLPMTVLVGRPLIMASAEGGMDIEEVNRTMPEKIRRIHIDPAFGFAWILSSVELASAIDLPRSHYGNNSARFALACGNALKRVMQPCAKLTRLAIVEEDGEEIYLEST